MTVEALREVMHQNVPFVVRSSDGKEFAIPHPDFISVGAESDSVVVIHHSKDISILAPANITAVDVGISATS